MEGEEGLVLRRKLDFPMLCFVFGNVVKDQALHLFVDRAEVIIRNIVEFPLNIRIKPKRDLGSLGRHKNHLADSVPKKHGKNQMMTLEITIKI